MIDLLNEFSKLTDSTLAASENGDWDAAENLQSKRELLMKQILKQKLPEDPIQSQQIADISSHIQAVDHKLSILANCRKDELLSEIKQTNKSKKMNQAYNQ